MKNYNYFSNFGENTEMLLGLGRYILFQTLRGTLPKNGVQEKMNIFFRGWCVRHPTTTRAFYAWTKLTPKNIWDTVGRKDNPLCAPVPTCYTSGKQLTSLNGTGQPLRWFELCMYVSVAKEFIDLLGPEDF